MNDERLTSFSPARIFDESSSMPPASLAALGISALALGQAVQVNNGEISLAAITWLTIALVAAGGSLVLWKFPLPPVIRKWLFGVLSLGLAWQITQVIITLPGKYLLPDFINNIWPFQILSGIGGGCALLSLAPKSWLPLLLRKGAIIVAFMCIFAAGIWTIIASPAPHIDTYYFQQTSAGALIHGQNPYELTEPSIYGNDMRFNGPELVINGRMTIGNPYPPLSIYLSTIGYLVAGDIRYSHLAAILAAAFLMMRIHPGRGTKLAAYLFLFTPRTFFVLEQSWTEPLVILLAVLVMWCAVHRPRWVFVAFGLLLASKQYMLFLFPLIFLLNSTQTSTRRWLKAAGQAIGAAFVVTAPLALWNISKFIWDVGLAQFYQVFRLEALSYAAVYARVTGNFPSQYLSFIILGIALVLVMRSHWRSPAFFAAGMAFCLAFFFAFSKQAWCNYYYLVIGLLCASMAVLPAWANQNTSPSAEQSKEGIL